MYLCKDIIDIISVKYIDRDKLINKLQPVAAAAADLQCEAAWQMRIRKRRRSRLGIQMEYIYITAVYFLILIWKAKEAERIEQRQTERERKRVRTCKVIKRTEGNNNKSNNCCWSQGSATWAQKDTDTSGVACVLVCVSAAGSGRSAWPHFD